MDDRLKDYFIEIPNYLSFFFAALFFMSISPIFIEMGKTFNTQPGELNLIYTFFTFGAATGRIATFLYRAKMKNFNIIIGAYILMSISILILSQINILSLFYIIYFICGHIVGTILIIATENILESNVSNKERLITIATTFFPIGAIIAPKIVSTLVNNGYDWKYLYYILLTFAIIMIILYSTTTRHRKYSYKSSKEKFIFRGIFTDKKSNILFIIMLLSIFFYIMVEYILSNWSPTFFRLNGILNIVEAGNLISIFYIANIIGRIIVSLITVKIKSKYIMLALAVISLPVTLLLYLSKSISLIYIFAILAGLGYSGLYPLIISTGSTVYKKGQGTLASIMFLSHSVGNSLNSFLLSAVSKYNLNLSVFISAIYISVIIILLTMFIFYSKNHRNNEVTRKEFNNEKSNGIQ